MARFAWQPHRSETFKLIERFTAGSAAPSSVSSWIPSTVPLRLTWMYISSWTITARIGPRPFVAGWRNARASTCTSRRLVHHGSIWSNAGSPPSQKITSAGVSIAASENWKRQILNYLAITNQSQTIHLDEDCRRDPRQCRAILSTNF